MKVVHIVQTPNHGIVILIDMGLSYDSQTYKVNLNEFYDSLEDQNIDMYHDKRPLLAVCDAAR